MKIFAILRFKFSLRRVIVSMLAIAALITAMLICVRTMPEGQDNSLHPKNERLQSAYEIDWTLDSANSTLRAHQQVDYVNADTVALHALYFHLYPNYFAEEDAAPFEEAEMQNAYPGGFSAGKLTLRSVTAGGMAADYRLEGEMQGILCIELSEPLQPGEHISCGFDYSVNLPACVGRFGAGDDTIQLCNAYPIAAVYDDEGWNLDPYHAIGDPFYSDVSDYTVRITCPSDYKITGTGKRSKLVQGSDNTTYTFACPDVRDVAFVAGKGLQSLSKEAAGVKVTSWFYSEGEGGQIALDSACAAVEIFSRMFGEYPYPELNVIESDLYYGGMEYPNAVLVTDRLYQAGMEDTLEYVTAHEVAHQWWYGVVGNNEIDEPWLDESLTEYSTLLYYRERYGEERFALEYGHKIELSLALMDYTVSKPQPVGLKTSECSDNLWYTLVVYKQGAHMFYELHQKMGDEAFKTALKAYYKNTCLLNATQEDLFLALRQATGNDWSGFITAYLKGEPEQ